MIRSSLLQSDTQLNQQSYYEASVKRCNFNSSLSEDLLVDVVVIGGGFAGLSAALELANNGYSVAILEADKVCAGASGRNGGQAIVGYASGMDLIEKQLGQHYADILWQSSLDAIQLIDQRIAQYQIDCARIHGYQYVADSSKKATQLESEMLHYENRYGLKTAITTGSDVKNYINSDQYAMCAYENISGHLHPLQYGLGLANAANQMGVKIYENSAVLELTKGQSVTAKTAKGQVTAKFAVVAGNCTLHEYGANVAPELKGRIMPVGTYIIGTSPIHPLLQDQLLPNNAAVCDNNFILDYFRFSQDHRMLFGGRVSYSTKTPYQLKEKMQARMLTIFPQLSSTSIDYIWGGFVDISMNRAPDFGRTDTNIYYLQGFSGHGVALTGLAGQLVAQAIRGDAEKFDIFSKIKHLPFPGGELLRTPALVLANFYSQIKDLF